MSEDTAESFQVIIFIGSTSTRELQKYLALERALDSMQIPHQVICRNHESRISVCDPRVHAILEHEHDVNSVRILNHRPQDVLSGIIERLMKNTVDIQSLVECSRLHFTYHKGHNYPWYLAFSGQRVPKVLGRKSSRR